MTTQSQPVYLRMTIHNIDDDQVFFSNENETTQPLEIEPGKGQIFPKIDERLGMMSVGERESVTLNESEAFGTVVQEAIHNVPVENLDKELREPGARVSAQTEDEQTVQGTVVEVNDETVKIDFNHPLAGKRVKVDFVVVDKPQN